MQNVILVTGAGTGIGKLSAQALAEAGHIVYATMRDVEGRNKPRADELRALAAAKGIALHPLELDVLSWASADAAVAAIVHEQGRLDVVMQNAGHLVVGPGESPPFPRKRQPMAEDGVDVNGYGVRSDDERELLCTAPEDLTPARKESTERPAPVP